MLINNFNIEQFLSLEGYSDSREDRRKGSGGSAEFFTPYSIVKKMCDKIPESDWADPNKTWLEPSMGNGQFILMILYRRIHEYKIPWMVALKNVYGVELMQDNVEECRERVHELLRNISSDYDPDIADLIMDKNFVCHDFFTWNFEEWREMTDEEIRKANVKPKKEKPKKEKKKDPLQLEIQFEL